MRKRIIYYTDPLNDDFAGTNIDTKPIPPDFPYRHRNILWLAAEFVLYRFIVTPIVFLYAKIGFGLRIRNRKSLKQLRHTGFYLYGNHTQRSMDAFIPTLCVFPKKAHVIAGADAFSIPGLNRIVQMLGGIPLPGNASSYRSFQEALKHRTETGHVITVYPEAHIWPWYTGIRPFPDTSFSYPVRDNVPAVAFTTTFRKRKVFRNLWPCLTVTLSEPFYPDPELKPREARKVLRDRVSDFMSRTAESPDNYAYIQYIKVQKDHVASS